MIQFAMEKLRIAGENGNPGFLDLATFEHEIAEAFRKAGFDDSWMAEDIALTVEEKIRGEEARLFSREDIDVMVSSLLNAAGFQDVDRIFISSRGTDRFREERRQLKKWNDGELEEVLERVLPLPEAVIQTLAAKSADVLKYCGLELAAEKFIVSLAIHIYLNDARDLNRHSTENVLNNTGKSRNTKKNCSPVEKYSRLMAGGMLRKMPCSSVFPRARVMVDFSEFPGIPSDGWISLISMAAPLAEIVPAAAELLAEAKSELADMYPGLFDIPASIVLTGLPEKEMRQVVAPAVKEMIQSELDFDCMVVVR